MGNIAVQKKQSGGTPSVAHALWNPFWFVQEMLSWGRPSDAPSLDVKETDDAYVCTVKLTLPDQADVEHVKAELENGELTLVVPKAAAAAPEPASQPSKTSRTTGNRRGSAAHTPRRGARRPT